MTSEPRSLTANLSRGSLLLFLLHIISIDLYSQSFQCGFNPISFLQARQGQASKVDEGQFVAIPVVVHVVYSSNEQNITDQQIYSQIKVLNEDYNRLNADSVNTVNAFKAIASSSKIHFYITDVDVQGNKTNGINRTLTTHIPFHDSDIHFSSKGGKDAWDTRRFLNIWVCDLADGVFGFASPPGTIESTDGVVIDYKYFGTLGAVSFPYHLGRTVTHEVGHYLGLKHLWGAAGACMDDDGLADTPQQFGPSSGCDIKRVSCGALNMVQNYMDTSDDQCMNLFTIDQVKEMRKNLFAIRSEVIREDIITGFNENEAKKIEWTSLPRNKEYRVTSPSCISNISIYNLQGQYCYLQDFTSATFETVLYLPNLNGVFIIVVTSEKEVKRIRSYLN